MKKMRKIFALLIAMVMVLSMGTSVFAAVTEDSGKGGDASITITLPTNPNEDEDPEITYHVYKVFDATQNGSAISYKIDSVNGDLSAEMTAAGFFVDDGGNVHYGTFEAAEDGTYVVGGVKGNITDKDALDQNALDAIEAYAVDEIGTGFSAKPSDGTLTITGLEYGYYYITTTTGSAVTVDSTKPNAEVEDKNSIPTPPEKTIIEDFDGSVDEDGKNAIAQVGTTVPFSVEIVKVKGAANYVFHDVMSDGLSYNDDVKVSVGGSDVNPSTTINTEADDETFTTTPVGDDTITVSFDNDWLAALADDTTITITYSATVTSDALSVDYANNTASLDYGDGNTTDMDEVKVYNAKITVTKEDGEGEPLADAGFVLMNKDGDYYKLTATTTGEGADAVTTYSVSWYTLASGEKLEDAIEAGNVTEYKSDADGAVTAFTGLMNGEYTLVESTVPDGYNKAADLTFTIDEGDYTADNLEQTSTVINEAGSVLPSTGGIGTTMFYVVGSVLVIGAAVVLISKRRMTR